MKQRVSVDINTTRPLTSESESVTSRDRHSGYVRPITCLQCTGDSRRWPIHKAIKARQSLMQLYSYHIGILSTMAKGKMDYDADLATEAANNLLAVNTLGQSTLWPQGTDDSDPENAENRALPATWETYPKVAEKGKALNEALSDMAAEAGNGLKALKGSIGDVGESCKGCHDDFRAEKD